MSRLDIDRQKELEPKRIDYAVNEIISLGYDITHADSVKVQFHFKGKTVTLYPYSGWFSGKTVKAGRGIKDLLNQIKK